MQAPIEITAKDRPEPRSVNTSALRGLVDERTNLVLSILVDQDLKHLLSLWTPLNWALRKAAVAYGRRIFTNSAMKHIEAALDEIATSFG